MAFPWQLALSAMETSADTSSVCTQERLDEATHHLQLSGRSSDRLPTGCLTLSLLVVGEAEEEGDNSCTFAFDLAPSPVHGFTTSTESPSPPTVISVVRSCGPVAQRLQLRC
jgi:hypothetical protein